MPTYEYKCPKCDTRFEVVQRMKDKPGAKCPGCGAKAVRQLSGGHGLVFKGSGFYITDYKHKEDKSWKPEDGGPKVDVAKKSPPSNGTSSGSSGTTSSSGSSD